MPLPGLAARCLSLSRSQQLGWRLYSSASGSATSSSRGHLQPLLQAAAISGSMSCLGDLLAQRVTGTKLTNAQLDRTVRMGGFGFFFYGPFQHYWYQALAARFPGKTAASFLTKLSLNMTVLGPIVLTTVFTWNLVLTGKADQLRGKLKRDLAPGMVDGLKFWVPAASINFYVVPLRWQVLYMSTCSVLWTAYLSAASVSSPSAMKQKL